jgi:hypothetical protein
MTAQKPSLIIYHSPLFQSFFINNPCSYMRQFYSYGPIDPKLHYYAPRQALINETIISHT